MYIFSFVLFILCIIYCIYIYIYMKIAPEAST